MSEKNYKLYMHECPNGKMYFGITCRKKVEDRWDYGYGYNYNEHFYNAIKKYDWNNIEHIVLAQNLTKEEACYYEEVLIAYFDTTNKEKGYNHLSGGEHFIPNEETRRKMSEAKKGNSNAKGSKRTKEQRVFLSQINIGNTNGKGKRSEETRRKMLGNTNGKGNKGKIHTEEQKRKSSQNCTTKVKVKCIELSTVFDSIAEANKHFGKSYNASNIQSAIKRNGKAFGYHWEYVEELL